jgi:hypothetical protein
MTSWLAEAVPYAEASLPALAKRILLRFGGYGLRPLEIVQRDGDRLFDYDLSFTLFSRSGTLRITAEGVYASFQNAKDSNDANLISDCLLGIGEVVSDRRMREHRLEAFVHASLSSVAERDSFLASLGPADRKLHTAGCILSTPASASFGEGRLVVDRSLAFPDAVFLNWAVQFSSSPDKQLFADATKMFVYLSSELGLEFPSA